MSRMIGVAIEIPEPWTTELTNWRAKIGDPQAHSVPPHVTLLPPTRLSNELCARAEEHLLEVAHAHRPFEMHLRGTGTFQPISDVVFVVVERGISDCEQLEGAVRVGPLDRPIDYPYHPHVTVAHAVPDDALDRAFDALAGFEAQFTVSGFTLFEHGRDGVWRPDRAFPFSGTPLRGRPLTDNLA
ncbi:MAG: 2'-5' RNA ligase family protein [Mycobacteriales bacterium]